MKLVIALVALLGVFASIIFKLLTDYFIWKKQKKADVFVAFIDELEKCLSNLTDLLSDDNTNTNINRTNNYQPVFHHARMVRLYISSDNRSKFCDLEKTLWGKYGQIDKLGSKERTQLGKTKDEIQELFESEIDAVPRPISYFGRYFK